MAKVLTFGVETRQHFTGYERDSESGLDYAHARYYSNQQGRFTSVDPLGKSANVLNPQSFNRYDYVLNNPVNLTDPSGMMSGADASQSWGDVAGLFWGEDFGFGGPHPMNGDAIVENGMNGFADRADNISYCVTGDCGDSDTGKGDGEIGAAGKGGEEETPETPGETDVPGGGISGGEPWPGFIHGSIIDEGFAGLTRHQRAILKQASQDVDDDQSVEGSYKHAMSAPNQLDLVALAKALIWAGNAMLEAKRLQREYIRSGGTGFSDAALYQIGKVIHLMTDSTSPEHAGFQVWDGLNGKLNTMRAALHTLGEIHISDAQMREAINAARTPFRSVFGERLSRLAFRKPK